ncbi:MAG: sensor histidine kinase [Lachnospiraceae bacterium]
MIEIWKVVLLVIILAGFAGLAVVVYYKYIVQKVNRRMEQVDNTIEQLLHHQKKNYFSETEDTLLGKFQHQIVQLYDILAAYEEREKTLRQSLNSSISDLVHQLNTPITNIKLYSGFLGDPELPEQQREQFIKNIYQQAEKLSWLGEGFAKLSRLEEGIIILNPKQQQVLPLILRAVDQVLPKAQNHQNDIELSGDRELLAVLDRKWTEEVFYNLLDNAVKYSDPGSKITVDLQRYEMYSRISMINYGITVAAEEYPLIFKRFYRSREVSDQDGVGLGLYLSRELIVRQKGFIKVEKGRDASTIFAVFLPSS